MCLLDFLRERAHVKLPMRVALYPQIHPTSLNVWLGALLIVMESEFEWGIVRVSTEKRLNLGNIQFT